jgi:hypothetical protein
MPYERPRLPSALACVLAAAGAVITVASCSHITPLGPDQAPLAMPPARHLGSPIVVQAMRLQPATAAGRCPASWTAVSLPAGGGPHVAMSSRHVAAPVPVGSKGASAPPPSAAPPPPPPSAAAVTCYRPAGAPVTITSAAASPVFAQRPPPGQAKRPDLYGFVVAVPGTDVAAVTAIIRHAYDTRSVVGISVAGKLWQASQVFEPFPGQRLDIGLLSRNQALRLHRILVPSG